MGSVRFPRKVMQKIHEMTLIQCLLSRLSHSVEINKIVLATTINSEDDTLAEHVEQLGYDVYRGSEKNVLDRFYQASSAVDSEIVVRITGDCPLIDPELVDQVILAYKEGGVDYASNVAPATYPDGLDTEVFSFQALKKIAENPLCNDDIEHVTVSLRESGNFKTINVSFEADHSGQRWTVDEKEDYEVVKNIIEHFYPRLDFNWAEVIELSEKKPELFEANQIHTRNSGRKSGSGQKLWNRAKQLIPGGSMLLSKRAELFLPEHWPAYFSKAKDCTVWDMDGNPFIDMYTMGIGTNTLGYGNDEVDNAVIESIHMGNMSSLNAPEEVLLAERLIDLHPFADMARFCRSGGEANSVAIRIARAASGRDKVAFCGYHGWHDWYIAANLSTDDGLSDHLLPGLEPKGVPKHLAGSVLPFNYNRIDELEAIIANHDIGVIKMEVSRNEGPQDGFLQKVRQLATENNIVLIFDECTSGFRETFGGLHKKFDVEPDLAVFGKALGNGYAVTAVIGRKSVMDAAQSTFISSTFWTERIGSVAALKTLEIMERERSWEAITATGNNIKQSWQKLADKYNLSIDLWGLPALCGFTFKSDTALAYKTLITQEALKQGYLGGDCVYVSMAHTPEIIEKYFDILDPIFAQIAECEEGRNVLELLNGPLCHTRFKRLN